MILLLFKDICKIREEKQFSLIDLSPKIGKLYTDIVNMFFKVKFCCKNTVKKRKVVTMSQLKGFEIFFFIWPRKEISPILEIHFGNFFFLRNFLDFYILRISSNPNDM